MKIIFCFHFHRKSLLKHKQNIYKQRINKYMKFNVIQFTFRIYLQKN